VASATYTIKAATPTISPAAGTYVTSVSVTISAAAGASIYYTTDGSTPTTASTLYSGAISVTQSRTIKAIAAAAGMSDSDVASSAYTIKAATPAISPAGGTYGTTQSVTITDATPGVSIYYTTNGSTPTTSSTLYTGPISVTQSTTVKAIAAGTGIASSDVATNVYTLQVATPTFTPPGGPFFVAQMITIECATPNVTIYYTTDGSTPTTASTVYTGPFLIVGTTTVKAIAVKSGWSNSAVGTAVYTFGL
jgi:hypothetical protein